MRSRSQNQQVAAGQLGMPPAPQTQPFQYTLDIAGRLDQVGQFEDIVVKTEQDGQMTHLRDVARIELGAQTYSQIFTLNGKPAAGIGIFQTLGGERAHGRRRGQGADGQAPKTFPPGLSLHHSVRYDDVRPRLDQRGVQDAVSRPGSWC